MGRFISKSETFTPVKVSVASLTISSRCLSEKRGGWFPFRGFKGLTIIHTSSNIPLSAAKVAMDRCPICMGSNEPPYIPTIIQNYCQSGSWVVKVLIADAILSTVSSRLSLTTLRSNEGAKEISYSAFPRRRRMVSSESVPRPRNRRSRV